MNDHDSRTEPEETKRNEKDKIAEAIHQFQDLQINLEDAPKPLDVGAEDVAKPVDAGAEDVREKYSFPTPILFEEMVDRFKCYKLLNEKDYNPGIIGLGVSHCLSYISYFCRYEGLKRGIDVVSVGSDDGLLDKEIVDDFYNHFMTKLEITSVNANPKLECEFKAVDDLIEKRPNLVSNCVLLLIWPKFVKKTDATTEIDVIRKLQPRSVLTVYEAEARMCGSDDFQAYLRGHTNYSGWDRYEGKSPGLDNYVIEEIGHQDVNFEAGQKFKLPADSEDATETIMKPGTRAFAFKIVRLKRVDCFETDAVPSSPETDASGDA